MEAELRRRIRSELEQARGEGDGQLDDTALAAIIARAIAAGVAWHLEAPEHTRNATLSSRTWRPSPGPRGGRPPEYEDGGQRRPREFDRPPPRDFDRRPPRDFDGPPREYDRPRREYDRDYEPRPPRREPRDFDQRGPRGPRGGGGFRGGGFKQGGFKQGGFGPRRPPPRSR